MVLIQKYRPRIEIEFSFREINTPFPFSSITSYRDNSTTNNPINFIFTPLDPHHRGQHACLSITRGTDEGRKGESIFPFKLNFQKFAISHFSDKWTESPTHTKCESEGG